MVGSLSHHSARLCAKVIIYLCISLYLLIINECLRANPSLFVIVRQLRAKNREVLSLDSALLAPTRLPKIAAGGFTAAISGSRVWDDPFES